MFHALLALMLVSLSQDGGRSVYREAAAARVGKAWAIAADTDILSATEAKNASGESMAEILRHDARWQRNASYALRKQVTSGACADRLRAMAADDPFIVELFVMDDQGALVCASSETSDYWQGDEEKFTRVFDDGARVFVSGDEYDESSDTHSVHLSVPLLKGGRRIGALTIVVRIAELR